MRRILLALATALLALALTASSAMAQISGEGLIEGNDRNVTRVGFIVIAFFPTFILFASLLQWRLDKRKEARKAAEKARKGSRVWEGGW
jgi:hypothetical protein